MKLVISFVFSVFSALAQHSTTLTWTWAQGGGPAATGFHVQSSQVSGGPYTVIATISDPTILTYVDTAVIAGQTTFYIVTAFNLDGDSLPSPEVTAVTPCVRHNLSCSTMLGLR
jgi:hypothetical protein